MTKSAILAVVLALGLLCCESAMAQCANGRCNLASSKGSGITASATTSVLSMSSPVATPSRLVSSSPVISSTPIVSSPSPVVSNAPVMASPVYHQPVMSSYPVSSGPVSSGIVISQPQPSVVHYSPVSSGTMIYSQPSRVISGPVYSNPVISSPVTYSSPVLSYPTSSSLNSVISSGCPGGVCRR